MIQRIFSKITGGTRSEFYVLSALFLIFFNVSASHANAAEVFTDTKTPVQILEVSKSSFNLKNGQSDYMVLSLINLSDLDKSVNIAHKSSSENLQLDYKENLNIPANSIVRTPVDIAVTGSSIVNSIHGLLQVSSENSDGPIELFVSQPFEIKLDSTIATPVMMKSKQFKTTLLVFLLLSLALAFVFFKKRHEYVPAFFLLAIGTYGMFGLLNDPFLYIAGNLQTDTLDSQEASTEESLSNENEYFLENYEYKSEDSESYIELYGTALDEATSTTFFYETELDFTEQEVLGNDILDGSSDVDLVDGTPDADLSTTPATEDVDDSIADNGATTDLADENFPSDPLVPIETLNGTVYQTEFGIQAPIIKGFHTEYGGLEMRVLAFLTPQNLSRDLVRKYIKIALSMTDGGEMRLQTLQLCEIFQKSNFDQTDKTKFQNIVLEMIAEDVKFETIQEYSDLIFEDSMHLMHEQANLICEDFYKAHDTAMKDVRIPETTNMDTTPATADADEVISLSSTDTPATENADTTNIAAATEIRADKPQAKKTTVQTTTVASQDGSIRTFSIFDVPNDLDESPNEIAVNNEDAPKEKPVAINLDLTESDLIEIIIPNHIVLPPLARQDNSYVARNSMGDFQIRTFNDHTDWNGFFTFEVIKLQNGEELTDMWLEINGKKIEPQKSMNSEKKYLNYQLSNDLLPTDSGNLFNFSPYIWIKIPAKASPGVYNSNISFTLIQ